MPTYFCTYQATIPPMFYEEQRVERLLTFLRDWEASQSDGDGTHFIVIGNDDDENGYRIKGDAVPSNTDVHGESYLTPRLPLLAELINAGKICLVEQGEWGSNGHSTGCYDYPEMDEVFDPVGLAEQIPTLILQEVLAKRLEQS